MAISTTRAIMLLGIHSNAGKSLLTTAFCRILARKGIRVAPFKAQNMSNNAGVTPEGGEMGRAQIVQAEAAGIPPHTDMNPVLLKPEANRRSQIVLNGVANGHIEAKNWFQIKQQLWSEVRAAYDRLAARFDVIVLEGAGSPAEINLKAGDIVNLRMARYANAPCLLIGDIDRGSVFAALAGTILLLEPEEREQISGFLINKFRGDPALLGNATTMLNEKAFGVPTLGVIPYLPDMRVADEDAVALDDASIHAQAGDLVDIAIVHLPHIANFDEFDSLIAEPAVRVRYVRQTSELGQPQAIIVPGSKVTLSDLAWMRSQGLDAAILACRAAGTSIIGICGGYQMLGQMLVDPFGVEGPQGQSAAGFGLLPIVTEFCQIKQTHRAKLQIDPDRLNFMDAAPGDALSGYEIHAGETTFLGDAKPLGKIIVRNGQPASVADGAVSQDGRVWGTYLHGIFDNDHFRSQWLRSLGWQGTSVSMKQLRIQAYDRLANAVEESVDWEVIERLINGRMG
ncbi:cobyric acid synthase [Chloroflexi bacterium TSY]|nr:cobyric acid synthase [Chloroflexi bacterium TSY]